MDSELASAMLIALTSDTSDHDLICESAHSINEQKNFIIVNSEQLSRADKICIGQVLNMNGKKDLMKETATGIHVDLDKISDPNIINQMYVLMNYKLKKIL